MKKAIIIVGILVLALAALFLFSNSDGGTSPAPGAKETPTKQNGTGSANEIPQLTLQNYDSENIMLDGFTGTPLVINSWATWCPFCINELPDLAAAQKEFGDKAIFIAINRRESLAQSRQYTDDLNITDDMIFLLDPSDSFYKNIGGFGMPETLFINADGKEVFHKRGPMELDEIREKTQSIL